MMNRILSLALVTILITASALALSEPSALDAIRCKDGVCTLPQELLQQILGAVEHWYDQAHGAKCI